MEPSRRLGDSIYPLSALIAALGVAALGAAALIYVLRSNRAAPVEPVQSERGQLSDEESMKEQLRLMKALSEAAASQDPDSPGGGVFRLRGADYVDEIETSVVEQVREIALPQEPRWYSPKWLEPGAGDRDSSTDSKDR